MVFLMRIPLFVLGILTTLCKWFENKIFENNFELCLICRNRITIFFSATAVPNRLTTIHSF